MALTKFCNLSQPQPFDEARFASCFFLVLARAFLDLPARLPLPAFPSGLPLLDDETAWNASGMPGSLTALHRSSGPLFAACQSIQTHVQDDLTTLWMSLQRTRGTWCSQKALVGQRHALQT
jgi:hypothetical protein